MEDSELVRQIGELTDEEHRLERSHAGDGLVAVDLKRLKDIEIELDQCWDLLRQRRARRDGGLDPDGARARMPETVESYEQ
ncbi:MAG: DUF2630 family protein [Microthrixaceae bacterium]